jgi:hypothetical protein
MLLSILRNLSSALLVLCFATSAMANDAFIYYKNSGSDATTSQYNNLKSELEDLGFTVTGSTSGTVSSTDVSGKELVIDITGTSNCGSNCKSVYDTYVSGGGKLVIAGVNGATNRNTSIEALIENKMGVGSFTPVGGCNTCYGSVAVGDYASSTASENTLPGPDKLFTASGGTAAAKNGTSSSYNTWYKWDYGSNGGAVYVTFGYGQFLSTHTYASNMNDFLFRAMQEEGLYSSSSSGSSSPTPIYSSGITAAQSTKRTSKLNDTATYGMEAHIDIDGNYNAVNITQAGDAHYLELGIVGNSNVIDIEQATTGSAMHYADITMDGSSNTLDILQTGTGPKTAFIGIDGDSNTADIIQKDAGSHYLQLDLIGDSHYATIVQEGSGNHEATVELANGGGAWTFELNQQGSTSKEYSLPHSMSDGSTTSGTCYVSAGCNLTVTQQD